MLKGFILYLTVISRRSYVKSRKYKSWKDAADYLILIFFAETFLFSLIILELFGVKGFVYMTWSSRKGTPWGVIYYSVFFWTSLFLYLIFGSFGKEDRKEPLRKICRRLSWLRPIYVQAFMISYSVLLLVLMLTSMFILYDRYYTH